MASLADLILRLEKRIFVLESLAGIVPAKEDLMHPKSYTMAVATEQAKIEAEKLAGKVEDIP